ncbi:hypothetical protein QIU18_10090 [Capnocytophaga canimorsus]|nr:hypothetical protein [Capnocytophaga canimorsus]WGU69911.1 hypothetical protein QIU18_10090 [Capnocytophaga canimorsus]
MDELAKAKNTLKLSPPPPSWLRILSKTEVQYEKNIIKEAESKAYARKYFDKFVKKRRF